jgi:hypothetical protein
MCKLEMKDFEKFSNSSDESTKTRRNFCHYLNVTLNNEFTSFWKDHTVILEGPFWPHRAILAFQNRGRFGSNRGQNRTLGAKTEH